ncbi:MAG: response regulator [Thermodesulfobacteriota bacterium]
MFSEGTVLVVDDNDSIKELLRNFLTENGYTVITASNATSGLEKLKHFNFDIIISDIMMPGISGIELLSEVHKHDPDLPVVMITGYPTIDTAVKVIKEGAADFITKPFNLDHAKLVIKKAIEEGRLKKKNKQLTEQVAEADKVMAMSKNLQEKVSELSALYTISDVFHHTFTTTEVLIKAIEVAMSVSEARKAAIWVYDKKNDEIMLKANKGMDSLVGTALPLINAGLVGQMFAGKTYTMSQNYSPCVCGESAKDQKHPFLCVPIMISNEVFAALQVCHKLGGTDFSRNDVSIMSNLAQKVSLRLENLALYENLTDSIFKSINTLVTAIDARDNYTRNHCSRVTDYAIELARALGGTEEIIDSLLFTGPIHDVGKIGVRDDILLKPAKLDTDEWLIMQNHVIIGDGIIEHLSLGPIERAIVRNHHEQVDGSGYPDGLKGDRIPFVARIFSIADTFDAMTTSRPYRNPRTPDEAIAELIRCSGTQFDGDLVEEFVKLDLTFNIPKPV